MSKLEFGIGFVTGRKNVCNIINNYYQEIQKQLGPETNLTFFILYDLNYTKSLKEDFYNIKPEVYESGVKIFYIGEQEILQEKEFVQKKYNLTKDEVDLFLGSGYARARNTILYCAKKNNIDYLLYWDDDEYPVACMKEENTVIWKKQENVAEHRKYIEHSNITIGYHCGYVSPIPSIDFNTCISEEDFKNYIDAVSNEVVFWDKIKEVMKQNGITYAQKEIVESKNPIILDKVGTNQWLTGSGLCINLKKIDKIPAFYNPPKARGEDTFFSTMLQDAQVYKIPVYHFHDGFLKYTGIMKEDYPRQLRKIKIEDQIIEKRFLDVSIGWIKYKPLLLYITNRQEYKKKISKTYKALEECITKMNHIFVHYDSTCLLEQLREYDYKVEEHYKQYLKTNEIWDRIKLN